MLWLREPTEASRLAGLGLGFAGVVLLARDAGSSGTAVAVGLCLVASLLYGFSACFTRRYLAAASPLAVAAGSQLSAMLALAAPSAWVWPTASPPWAAWMAVLALALLCTGVAYVLYFRLIARIGPARAITVTFLVPAFAMLWAGLVLGEAVSPSMLAVCALILLGTGLAAGVLRLPLRSAHKEQRQ
jgi:drug/metabolite transporter (DMT)-like permease